MRVFRLFHETQEPDMDDRWLSVDQSAEHLGVSEDAVYSWVTAQGMPGYKVGRFWTSKKEGVDAWVREGGASAPRPTREGDR